MWARRFATATVMILLAGLGLTPANAAAGGFQEPMYGDLNNDGIADRALLVSHEDTCGVRVELGNGSGGYGTPTVHPYQPPGTPDENDDLCPDVGVIVDLGGDGINELVVTWFVDIHDGDYGGILVLRDYQVVKRYDNGEDGTEFGLADLNGDGLTDIYVTVAFAYFYTLLNTPSGDLVRGPMKFCAVEPQVTLADFDGNGATDVVLSYLERCSDQQDGVVVVLDDGSLVHLHEGERATWRVQIGDVNRDGRPDVQTTEDGTNQVTTHINRDGRSFVIAPLANDDLAHAYRNIPKVIKIRSNDYASTTATLTIVTPPRYGHLSNHDPRYEIVYIRDAAHSLADSFVYQLGQDGRTDTAAVTIRMKG